MAKRIGDRREAARRQILMELEESGLSVAAFARERGVSAWTIYAWRRQRREQAERETEEAPFIEVRVPPDRPVPLVMEVELRAGLCVRVPLGFDEHDLRRLLGVLASC